MLLISAFRIACSREVRLLLCVVTLQQAIIASAEHCSDPNNVGRSLAGDRYADDDGCYAEACSANPCTFGCINDNGDGTHSCDSHMGEYTVSDWNSWGMESSCRCARSPAGIATCERIPCAAAPRGDDSCWSANDGMCDEPIICDELTDCSDCGNCGYDDCDEDCQAALAGILVVLLLGCVCTFIGIGVGIYCCISSKSKALDSRPSAIAWLASLLICLFLSPLCMWIPFVIDSCYVPNNRPANVVITQQMQQQPFIVQAQPMAAQAQGQPMMVVAHAQPMMPQAQAQPMAMAAAQAQPMAKQAQGP